MPVERPTAIRRLQDCADWLPLEEDDAGALDERVQGVREEIDTLTTLQAAVLEHLGPWSPDEPLEVHRLRLLATR